MFGCGPALLTPASSLLPGADPYFANVSLLLHFDGANGSTSVIDNSPSPKTISVLGNAAISTTQSVFGASSLALDGTGDYIRTPNHSSFQLTGDGTVECFIRPANVTGTKSIVAKRGTGSDIEYQLLLLGNKLYLDVLPSGGLSSLIGTTNVTANAQHHVAATKQGPVWRIFLDGNLEASATVSGSHVVSTQDLHIGYVPVGASTWYFNGFIDECRITKGVARYTANFTPPTAAFPDF